MKISRIDRQNENKQKTDLKFSVLFFQNDPKNLYLTQSM